MNPHLYYVCYACRVKNDVFVDHQNKQRTGLIVSCEDPTHYGKPFPSAKEQKHKEQNQQYRQKFKQQYRKGKYYYNDNRYYNDNY